MLIFPAAVFYRPENAKISLMDNSAATEINVEACAASEQRTNVLKGADLIAEGNRILAALGCSHC
jgi:hypothetical protein